MELPTMDVIKVPGGEEKERGRKINNDQKCSSLKKKKNIHSQVQEAQEITRK